MLFANRSVTTKAQAMVFKNYGPPAEVLKVHSFDLPSQIGSNQVQLKTLASPINPSDINQVEGVYPSYPPFNRDLGTVDEVAVGGNEGLFQVERVGTNVTNVKVGDWVLPRHTSIGSWRSAAILESTSVTPIKSNNISITQAATVGVNPCTAFIMLKDFVKLEKGDWFIQNGGNSGVSRAASQLGKLWGYNSISVVRNRPNIDELKQELKDLGATIVITEEELADRKFQKDVLFSQVKQTTGSTGQVKIALNCIGGKSATNIARVLSEGGNIITYGAMSKQPFSLPTGLFIFKDIHAHGYWLSRFGNKKPDEKKKIIEEIFDLYRTDRFKDVPVDKNIWKLSNTIEENGEIFIKAIKKAMEGGHDKQIIIFE
ncbi:enoyl-reductase 1 mitochondrial precursor [Nadsonia fulvescens var. elongata DSM 6958]|uniref:enoyl-[acyl-carrier-protein] reductase n=1 Tax=Nadsonia fulvescens var. elongata DSM 6958 TaxID=857566 RepID=A0A1E3PHW6_9ASCO|nr:enoyl-reductase 1 mitochondrial precursor [Nadsonia fulvescens var. elongata DSM 6958]